MATPPIVLASGSATRARLLRDAGLAFEAALPTLDEQAAKQALVAQGRSPAQVAGALAEAKALAVSTARAGLVIGADQTLDLDGRLMDKPRDLMDARRQLSALRGRRHRLHSALAVAEDGAVVWRHLDTAVMEVRAFSAAFLDAYLDREGAAILGCVGCYRLEGEGVQLFQRIEGDYFTVLGLPLPALLAFLRQRRALLS